MPSKIIHSPNVLSKFTVIFQRRHLVRKGLTIHRAVRHNSSRANEDQRPAFSLRFTRVSRNRHRKQARPPSYGREYVSSQGQNQSNLPAQFFGRWSGFMLRETSRIRFRPLFQVRSHVKPYVLQRRLQPSRQKFVST